MGLIMLILVGVLPGAYAIDLSLNGPAVQQLQANNRVVSAIIDKRAEASAAGVQLAATSAAAAIVPAPVGSADDAKNEQTISDYIKANGKLDAATYAAIAAKNRQIADILAGKSSLAELPKDQRKPLRTDTYLVSSALDKMAKNKAFSADDLAAVKLYRKSLDKLTHFIPVWVKVAIALALGLGTMIGWKRIVVTVGSKIGKAHLTYGQGAAAELVAYATIQGADILGLPVSTTHILSSGVAGTMAANHSGLQGKTLRDILLAWVLTLPVCVFMGSMLFAGALLAIEKMGFK
jgi:PiT family inorganic phosphate transporter